MDRGLFEELVAHAIEHLPEEFRERLENVEVLVEDYPTRAQLRTARARRGTTLLGLYEGVPQTERFSYNMVLPDKITIFQQPIESACRTDAEVTSVIERVVRHEIAHHFGISDERLKEFGAY
jgi:predicted Zn-dependent protease with MMP-like domain